MATLQRNKVVIYTHRAGSATIAVRAYVVTVTALGVASLAEVGAGHADIDAARNAVYATEDLTEIEREVYINPASLVGA